MKNAIWVVLAVIGGFLLGGMSPRRELARAKDDNVQMEKRLEVAEKKARRAGGGGGFLGLPAFPIPPAPEPKASVTPRATGDASASEEPSPSGTPFDRMAAFNLAVEAQKLRASQSRTALFEAAKLDAKGERAVDDVVAKMNAQLAQHAAEIASVMADMSEGKDPDPAELLSITHDVSGILLDSQNQFQTAVGALPDGMDPTTSQVWNYVDASIFKSVMENLPAGLKK